jgi:hypothetical protein
MANGNFHLLSPDCQIRRLNGPTLRKTAVCGLDLAIQAKRGEQLQQMYIPPATTGGRR